MTMPASGNITMAEVNVELGRASTDPIDMGEDLVRQLAEVYSGQIGMSDLYSKAAFPVTITMTLASVSGSKYGFDRTVPRGSTNKKYVKLALIESFDINGGASPHIMNLALHGTLAAGYWTTLTVTGASIGTQTFTSNTPAYAGGLTTWTVTSFSAGAAAAETVTLTLS